MGQVGSDDWRVEYPNRTFEATGVGSVELVNTWGDVRVSGDDVDQIHLSLAVQRHREDPRDLDVDVEMTATGLRLEVGFVDNPEVAEGEDWTQRRIDVGLLVPSRIMTAIRTIGGQVEIEDLRAPSRVETLSGAIRLRLRADARATSDQGDIRATALTTTAISTLDLETSTGDLRLELPEGSGATIGIETSGTISTDFSLEIERAPGSRRKRGRVRIGDGAMAVELQSQKGAVQLVALTVPVEP